MGKGASAQPNRQGGAVVAKATSTRRPAAFPHRGYPCGWFQVAWSGDVQPGDVIPLRYFGQDLVLFRTGAGHLQVLDGHCLHMGAHLGYGGTVAGEDLVCPYHGWCWNRDGRNTMVPSTGQATSRRRLRSWPTAERNEIVWVWHDALGRSPLWAAPLSLPGIVNGETYRLAPDTRRQFAGIRMRPQYVAENNVDLDHLHLVHRADGPIELLAYCADDWSFRTSVRMTYGFGKPRTRLTPDGPIDVVIDAEIWGLGYQYTHFPPPARATSIQAQTPIDEERCDMFQSVVVYREPGQSGERPEGVAAARVREQLVQIERDIPIWEHLRYLPDAALTRQEAKPLVAVRRWAQRFYPDGASIG
jgi:3-ketosteroid 9alpha-monooxygenase subunit A